jgi:hypothetical protein
LEGTSRILTHETVFAARAQLRSLQAAIYDWQLKDNDTNLSWTLIEGCGPGRAGK